MTDDSAEIRVKTQEDIFEVSIKGPGMDFSHKVDEKMIPTIIGICYGTSKPGNVSSFPGAQQDSQAQPTQKEALREYVNRLDPQYEAQRILTFAGYIKKHRGQDSFDRNTVKSLYREAQEVVPANLGRDVSAAIRKGWLANDREKPGSFYVTNSGEKLLESGELPRITRKRVKQAQPRTSGVAKGN